MKSQPVITKAYHSSTVQEASTVQQDGRPGKPFPLVGIVDGDHSNREAIRSLLRSGNYRTAVFESAEAFLIFANKHEIGCLVMDVKMPGLGGLILQRQLAAMDIPIPVILVTEFDDVSQRALDQGTVAVLPKPLNGETLLSAVQLALRLPMICKIGTALLASYDTATLLYAQCVSELNQKLGTCSQLEYQRLRRTAEDVRNQMYRAFEELEHHLAEHGCESVTFGHCGGGALFYEDQLMRNSG